LLLKQEGAPMFNVYLSTREIGGPAVVALGGELDLVDAGGDLLLAAPRGPVLRVLAITRLVDVFSVHASVEEAADKDGLAFRSAARNAVTRDPAAGVPFTGCPDDR
jgi:hypothetical protein